MQPTALPLLPDVQAGLPGAAAEGAALVKAALTDPPEKVIAAIDAFVTSPPRKFFGRVDTWTDRALPVGSLWGEQLVREFGWAWGQVKLDEDEIRIGVFSKDRSLAIYPWEFVFDCLENETPVTILLAFNMLQAGSIPAFPPNSFEDVMEGVHHIVPPGE
jgi:hypothetical protein